MRKLKSPWDKVVVALCIALVIFQIYTVFGMLPDLIKRSIHLGFVLTLRSVYKELHAGHETGAADNK